MGGLEADKIVPSRRNAHRPAGVRPDGRRGQPLCHRSGGPRGRAARHRLLVVDAGRRGGDRVQAQPGKRQFRHMGLAQTDRPLQRRRLQGGSVGRGRAPLEQGRSGLGRDPGGIEQVLPAQRHPVQRPAAQTGLGAPCGPHRLAARAGFGGAGIDARGQRVAGDGAQKILGQLDRVDPAALDVAAKLGRRHVAPGFHRDPPLGCRLATRGAMDNPARGTIFAAWNRMSSSLAVG